MQDEELMKKPAQQKIALILVGLCLSVLFIELGLRAGGLLFLSLQEYRNLASIRQKGAYRIMCLGESTTAMGGEYSYPSQLEKILNQWSREIKFSVINKGMPGTNTTGILAQLENNLNKYSPNMVVAMTGINDEYGKFIPYEDSRIIMDKSFLKDLRIYKLIRLLWQSFMANIKNLDLFNADAEAEEIAPDVKFYLELASDHHDKGKYELEELMYKKALEINPYDYNIYLRLGQYYMDLGLNDKAKKIFTKALNIKPEDFLSYLELGKCYRNLRNYDKAETMFKKAVRLNRKSDTAYLELGKCYREKKEYDRADLMYKKALKINAHNKEVYLELVWYHDFETLEKIYKKAMEKDIHNYKLYLHLGRWLINHGEYSGAEKIFKRILEINPEDYWVYFELGGCYLLLKDYSEAERMYKITLNLNPDSHWAYAGLAVCYKELGNHKLSEEYSKKATRLRLEMYNPTTRYNYLRLKNILIRQGIKLVCVEYPVRSVEPLKRMIGIDKGVSFVDNEKVFQEVIKNEGYQTYFINNFGGNFGHCTPKGNRLLAENIAKIILNEMKK